jgi:hypothetical protein
MDEQHKRQRSREVYLASPKGLEREAEAACDEGIFGEERGDGDADAALDLGKSSRRRRPMLGVGGVELLAMKRNQVKRSLSGSISSNLRDVLSLPVGRVR